MSCLKPCSYKMKSTLLGGPGVDDWPLPAPHLCLPSSLSPGSLQGAGPLQCGTQTCSASASHMLFLCLECSRSPGKLLLFFQVSPLPRILPRTPQAVCLCAVLALYSSPASSTHVAIRLWIRPYTKQGKVCITLVCTSPKSSRNTSLGRTLL